MVGRLARWEAGTIWGGYSTANPIGLPWENVDRGGHRCNVGFADYPKPIQHLATVLSTVSQFSQFCWQSHIVENVSCASCFIPSPSGSIIDASLLQQYGSTSVFNSLLILQLQPIQPSQWHFCIFMRWRVFVVRGVVQVDMGGCVNALDPFLGYPPYLLNTCPKIPKENLVQL